MVDEGLVGEDRSERWGIYENLCRCHGRGGGGGGDDGGHGTGRERASGVRETEGRKMRRDSSAVDSGSATDDVV